MSANSLKQEAEAKGIPYEKMGRVLVWHDEFDGDGIDPKKWCFKHTMGAGKVEYDNSERQAGNQLFFEPGLDDDGHHEF